MSVQESLGADLAAAREARDLTLEQVEQQIKIRVHYLAALENDDYAALPSIVQGRGFLRNYARFLKLDVDEIETRFNLGLIEQSRSRRRRTSPPPTARSSGRQAPSANTDTPLPARRKPAIPPNYTPVASTSPVQVPTVPGRRNGLVDPSAERAEQRRRQTRAMTMRAVGALIVAAFILVVLLTYGTHPNLIPGPIAAVLGIQSTATTTPTALPPTVTIPTIVATVQPTTALAANLTSGTQTGAVAVVTNGVAIEITVHDRAPLQIKVDDQIVYSGVPVPNTVLKYQGKQSIQVHTGDAGSLEISVNGIKQPAIGLPHTIADKTFTVTDSQVPVATAAVQPTSAFITFTPGSPSSTAPPTVILPTVGLKP